MQPLVTFSRPIQCSRPSSRSSVCTPETIAPCSQYIRGIKLRLGTTLLRPIDHHAFFPKQVCVAFNVHSVRDFEHAVNRCNAHRVSQLNTPRCIEVFMADTYHGASSGAAVFLTLGPYALGLEPPPDRT
eukprot:3160967-Rhodomonas_salina.2